MNLFKSLYNTIIKNHLKNNPSRIFKIMNILLKLKRYIMSIKERKNKNNNEIFKNVEAQNGNPMQFKKSQERISKEIRIFQEEQVEIRLNLSTILSSYHNNLHPNLPPSKPIKISLSYLIHKYQS